MSSGYFEEIADEFSEQVEHNMSAIDGVRYCKCGDRARMWSSWKPNNPGRRFLGCPNYKDHRHCRFFMWVDPELKNDCYKKLILSMRSESLSSSLQMVKLNEEVKEKNSEIKLLREQLEKARLKTLKVKRMNDQPWNGTVREKILLRVCMMLVVVIIAIIMCFGHGKGKTELTPFFLPY